jgi:nicotinamidase-related amidase
MAHPVGEVVARAAALAAAFRRQRLPVVLVNAAGTPSGRSDRGGGEAVRWPEEATRLVPELDAQEGDLRITKTAWGAFAGTDLQRRLEELGVTSVVLAGVATSFGVESTARAAYDLGFHVVLAVDAMTDVTQDAHDHAVSWTSRSWAGRAAPTTCWSS